MRNFYIYLLVFLGLPISFYGQANMSDLSFDQADNIAGEYYRKAINGYADQLEGSWQAGLLKSGAYQMPFEYYINGDCPADGYPLYVSMHGGGGATAEENDQQWENQKTLYGVVNGVYFVPRAPTDTWNMWHQEYMDDFLKQVVAYSIARLNVDPSRVYILGYSAGGDGVFNLAPRLSDRFAAAAMMAGHPGDAQIENLRNLPFAIYMGVDDTAYNRSGLAFDWLKSYQKLNGEDPGGFEYNINIYGETGHWMNGLDREAIGWLAEHRRITNPGRIIWIQDDVLHTRKHNLEVSNPQQGFRLEQLVDYENNTIYLYSDHYKEVTVWLDDFILDLNKPVIIMFNDSKAFEGIVARKQSNIIESIEGRFDPEFVFWSKVTVKR